MKDGWGRHEFECAGKQASPPHRFPPPRGIQLTLSTKSAKKPVVLGGVRAGVWALEAELPFSMD